MNRLSDEVVSNRQKGDMNEDGDGDESTLGDEVVSNRPNAEWCCLEGRYT